MGEGRRYLNVDALNAIIFYQAPTWNQGDQKIVLKYRNGSSDVVFSNLGGFFLNFGNSETTLVSATPDKVVIKYGHEGYEFNIPAATCTQIF